jgi:hypothetical protein
MKRDEPLRKDVLAAFAWSLAIRGETEINLFGMDFDYEFGGAWRTWSQTEGAELAGHLPNYGHEIGGRPSDMLLTASERRSHGAVTNLQEINNPDPDWTFEEQLDFLCEHQPHLGEPDHWLALADIYLARINKKD